MEAMKPWAIQVISSSRTATHLVGSCGAMQQIDPPTRQWVYPTTGNDDISLPFDRARLRSVHSVQSWVPGLWTCGYIFCCDRRSIGTLNALYMPLRSIASYFEVLKDNKCAVSPDIRAFMGGKGMVDQKQVSISKVRSYNMVGKNKDLNS
jgi:hypothetical protein